MLEQGQLQGAGGTCRQVQSPGLRARGSGFRPQGRGSELLQAPGLIMFRFTCIDSIRLLFMFEGLLKVAEAVAGSQGSGSRVPGPRPPLIPHAARTCVLSWLLSVLMWPLRPARAHPAAPAQTVPLRLGTRSLRPPAPDPTPVTPPGVRRVEMMDVSEGVAGTRRGGERVKVVKGAAGAGARLLGTPVSECRVFMTKAAGRGAAVAGRAVRGTQALTLRTLYPQRGRLYDEGRESSSSSWFREWQ